VSKRNRRPPVQPDSTEWRCNRRIPSDLSQGVALIRELIERLRAADWSDGEIFGIHLSMEEALANAIRHGNGQSLDKVVRVIVRASTDQFYAKVSDEGPGFDPSTIPDPTTDENLERPCGRGLMLMRCYMDRVVFSRTGNSVEMYKNRATKPSD
jgi:serine/threonine-protein kinase RsbW